MTTRHGAFDEVQQT
ncbi:Uncharacterised protein g9027 [Pycnogonum litorale]